MVEAVEEKKPEQPATEPSKEAEKDATAEKTPEEPPKEMRSIVLTSFGGLKSVKILKKPEPTVGADDVIIRVKAW
jgi:hypothetical protein